MVSSCMNPACNQEFRFLNTGALYAFEKRSADTEFFWLCSACAQAFVLRLDSTGHVSVRPRSSAASARLPNSFGRLQLIYRPIGTAGFPSGLTGERRISHQFEHGSLLLEKKGA